MDVEKLARLVISQADTLTSLGASHRALERAVFALIDTHADKSAFLARLHKHLELDTVTDLYEPLVPELVAAYEQKRERLLAAAREICSKSPPAPESRA